MNNSSIHNEFSQAFETLVAHTPPTPTFDQMLQRAAEAGASMPEWAPSTVTVPSRSVAPTKRSKRVTTFIGSILAISLVGGGGYMGYASLVGTDGYDTPTEAVDGFFDGLEAGNLLKASRALAPFERDTVARKLPSMLNDAKESKILADNDLSTAKNIKLQRHDLTTTEVVLGEGITRVDAVGGTLDLTMNRELLGDAFQDSGGEFDTPIDLVEKTRHGSSRIDPENGNDIAVTASNAGLVTVERGGSWYVSLSYTLMEYFRINDGLPVPSFAPPATSGGFATPEEAATAAADAANFSQPVRFSKVLDPQSGEGILPYLAGMESSPGAPSSEATERTWKVETEGGVTVAKLQTLTVRSQGQQRTYDANSCATPNADDSCALGVVNGLLAHGLELVQRDGRWYVDPIATSMDFFLTFFLGVRNPGPVEVVSGREQANAQGDVPSVVTPTPSTVVVPASAEGSS